MGATMPSLVEHAHGGRTPAPLAWLLSAATALVLAAAMGIASSLRAWDDKRSLHRRLVRTCAVVAVLCPALAAARPAPLPICLVLVVLLAVPWSVAVTRRATWDVRP
ncbi:hypothetical protein [Actinomadura nitritigenes]|uniref:hypothetical protein n=1 Tax=Actinomadura nitritigenes TaxID=134602 RepID=UPI003D8E594B